MPFNEWRWETHGPFSLTAAVLRGMTPGWTGQTWQKNIRKADKERQEKQIPSIFE